MPPLVHLPVKYSYTSVVPAGNRMVLLPAEAVWSTASPWSAYSTSPAVEVTSEKTVAPALRAADLSTSSVRLLLP